MVDAGDNPLSFTTPEKGNAGQSPVTLKLVLPSWWSTILQCQLERSETESKDLRLLFPLTGLPSLETPPLAGSLQTMLQNECRTSAYRDNPLKRANPINIWHCCSERLRNSRLHRVEFKRQNCMKRAVSKIVD